MDVNEQASKDLGQIRLHSTLKLIRRQKDVKVPSEEIKEALEH